MEKSCWIFAGYTDPKLGYGRIWGSVKGQYWYAHRVAYENWVGKLIPGLVLDHLCRVPQCINPVHLEQVKQKANVLRGIGPLAANYRKTHCKRGHEFNEANTYVRPKGGRMCRMCNKLKLWEVK